LKNLKPNPTNTILLTAPRSGSNLLENTLEAMSLIRILKTHSCWHTKNKNIITIVRDPLDTITSWAAMRMHYRNGEIKKDLVKHYCSIYTFLINNADVILDYNDLIDNPYGPTKNVADYMGIKTFFSTPEIARNSDTPSRRYLVSSTSSDYYKVAQEIFRDTDLSECYRLYNQALSLKTKFAQ
jgi:hypothetical protein